MGAAASVTAALAFAAPASAALGYLSQIGTTGAGPGQFYSDPGVAVGPDGNLYVADSGNNRVEVMTPDGAFVRAWGGLGTGNGQFDNDLSAIAVGGSGDVYTAETVSGGGITPTGRDQIQRFSSDGTFKNAWLAGTVPPFLIHGIAVDGQDNVYIITARPAVYKYTPDGTLETHWGSAGVGPGQFSGLVGIATDGSGNVYTLEGQGPPDTANDINRVQKFDGSGNDTPSLVFPVANPALIGLNGISVDAAGNIYLSNGGDLDVFTSAGAPAAPVTGCKLSLYGVAAHPNGKIYVTDKSGLAVFGEGGTQCSRGPTPIVFNGKEGVSVNAGALYTNDPSVKLTIVPPGGATEVLISNDGGFAAPIATGSCVGPTTCETAISPGGIYGWTMQPAADERLPKTVYVRFANSIATSATTFTDDIILDTIPPVIASASVAPSGSSLDKSLAITAAAGHRYSLRVGASDNASDVGHLQTATDTTRPSNPIAYQTHVTISASAPPSYVRVMDGAGNWSAWHKLGLVGLKAAPAITAFSLTNKGFAVNPNTTATKQGTTFAYTLSAASTATILIERKSTGRIVRSTCVRQTKSNARGKSCTLYTKAGTLTRKAKRGKNKLAFNGRIAGKALAPAGYRATITAQIGAGQISKPRIATFTVLRG